MSFDGSLRNRRYQAILGRLLTQHKASELSEDLQSLQVSSEELNRYIQSILKVLRVESRDFKLHIEVGDINEVIEQALTQLRPLAEEKKISMKKDAILLSWHNRRFCGHIGSLFN